MKILIIGYGLVGSVLSRMLISEKYIDLIIVADFELKKSKGNKKIKFIKTDASNKKQILDLLTKTKPDILINASLPNFNSSLLDCCVRKKVNYIDLASYWDFNKNLKARCPYKVEQLSFDKRFAQNKLVGLINAGISPGLTNLLAKECADLLDKVKTIKIRLFEDTQTNELYFPWSIEWFLDEINWKPLIYRNGKFRLMKSFSEKEIYNFPQPIGKREVCLISQEEVATIPLFIKGIKNVDIKSYDNQVDIAKLLFNLGLVSEEKIKIKGREITPLEFLSRLLKTKKIRTKSELSNNAQFGLVVEADGEKDNKNVTIGFYIISPKQKDIEKLSFDANFISYPTALMVKMFILHFPKIKKYGVYPPEALEKKVRKLMLNDLKKQIVLKKFARARNSKFLSEILPRPAGSRLSARDR